VTDHNRIVTPSTDPGRFTADEREAFEAGRCSELLESGVFPTPKVCGRPSAPGASFGLCAEHYADMLDAHYPDGTPRSQG
jgi:hypothetical protein